MKVLAIHNKPELNTKKDLQEIILLTKTARQKLEDLIFQCEEQTGDVSELDAAADALSDAVEILEESWEDFGFGG